MTAKKPNASTTCAVSTLRFHCAKCRQPVYAKGSTPNRAVGVTEEIYDAPLDLLFAVQKKTFVCENCKTPHSIVVSHIAMAQEIKQPKPQKLGDNPCQTQSD